MVGSTILVICVLKNRTGAQEKIFSIYGDQALTQESAEAKRNRKPEGQKAPTLKLGGILGDSSHCIYLSPSSGQYERQGNDTQEKD